MSFELYFKADGPMEGVIVSAFEKFTEELAGVKSDAAAEAAQFKAVIAAKDARIAELEAKYQEADAKLKALDERLNSGEVVDLAVVIADIQAARADIRAIVPDEPTPDPVNPEVPTDPIVAPVE